MQQPEHQLLILHLFFLQSVLQEELLYQHYKYILQIYLPVPDNSLLIAAKCTLPVCGVPVPSKYLRGQDSLYSIVQMPKGVPVATFAIGEAGAANAALYAAQILSVTDATLADKLAEFRKAQNAKARAMELPL